MEIETATDLISLIQHELQSAWREAMTNVDIQLQFDGHPILCSLLRFSLRLPINATWNDALMAFNVAAKRTTVVYSHWIDHDTGDLRLNAGHQVLNSIRTDRGLASKVHSILFNEPFSSTKRLQSISITPNVDNQALSSMKRLESISAELLEEKQIVASFLRFSLRLSSMDIAHVLEYMGPLLSDTDHAPFAHAVNGLRRLDDAENRDLPIAAAVPVLKRALDLVTFDEISSAMNDMSALSRIGYSLFAARYTGKYSVLVYFSADVPQRVSVQLAPSYFVRWRAEMNAIPQVHIPECRIGSMGNCHLITFHTTPTVDQLQGVKEQLGELLQARGSRVVCSEVFKHEEDTPIFDLDGSICRLTLDKVLSPLAKSALSLCVSGTVDRQAAFTISNGAREPVSIIIWARQSHDSATSSISRQVWSALTNKAPPLMSMHPEDRVVVVIEYCSSSQHPWTDRQTRTLIPADRPLQIITANPDRLTRRPSELSSILTELKAAHGTWWSQGSKFEGNTLGAWFKPAELSSQVEDQLRCDRQRALQMGFYTRCVSVMTRCIVAHQANPSLRQLTALKNFVRVAIDMHRIRRILIVIRDSPPQGDESHEARTASASLARQLEFLKSILPAGVEQQCIRLAETSACSSTIVIDHIREELQLRTGKAMVVSSALDRVIRSRANYDQLRATLTQGGHLAMSLLWDPATIVEPTDAMLLRPAL